MTDSDASQEYQEKYATLKKRYKMSLSRRAQLMEKLENARHKIRHLQSDTEKLIDAWSELQKRVLIYKKRGRKRQKPREDGTSDMTTEELEMEREEEEEDNDDEGMMSDSLSDSDGWDADMTWDTSFSSEEDVEDGIDREIKKLKGRQQKLKREKSLRRKDVYEEDLSMDTKKSHRDQNDKHEDTDDGMNDGDGDDAGNDDDDDDELDDDDNLHTAKEPQITMIDSIPMNEQHQVLFPFPVGKGVNEVQIINLGEVMPQKAGYDTTRYVFPLGFTSRRRYLSCKHPGQRTTYTNRILMTEDQGEFPLFEVVADDDLQNPIGGHSCSGVWKTVKMRANETRKTPIKNASPSGPDYFGLSYPLVTFLIQRLPHVTECKKYISQEFKWDGPDPIIPDHAMQSIPPPLHLIENLPSPFPEESDPVS
jgi:hypothetical protein